MVLFNELPLAVKTLWAKSNKLDEGYGILCHLFDVAAVAEVILEKESDIMLLWVADNLGLTTNNVIRWVSTLAGLHDFGKAIAGFQQKWEPGKLADQEAGLTFPQCSLHVKKHDYAINSVLRNLLLEKIGKQQWTISLIHALSAHHGYFPNNEEKDDSKPRNEDSIWKETRQLLFNYYWETLAPQSLPSIDEVQFPVCVWFAGLVSISDWIGSNQEWFPLRENEPDKSLIEHFEQSKILAKKALVEIGWSDLSILQKNSSTIEELLAKILDTETNIVARPLQIIGQELIKRAKEPSLMIVEAPMGEGKTELAYLAYLHLQAVNQHKGLYLALPTQATSNALFDRTLKFLKNFTSTIKLDIQLVHSGALLNEKVQKLRQTDTDTAITSSFWFSQRRRGLISSYGVGTIDQTLFATLNVKHHFVRFWGMSNRVVILDEVHAYDTYTTELIVALLSWLKAMNCSVVLMSATLPNQKRVEFINAWSQNHHLKKNENYPRLTLVNDSTFSSKNVECRLMAPVCVSGINEDLQSIAEAVIKKLELGGCGVVILNTVQRAQDLYLLLKQIIPFELDLMLFHARFPADERLDKEKTIIEKFGKSSNSTSRPSIALLIATQVVEQSLDIDFDFMFSDLAPIDLLLQRVGRLHRHERKRPKGHETPCFLIAGMICDKLPDIFTTNWKWVYEPYILYRTWIWISKESIWQLPLDIDRFVQLVYDNTELPENMSEEVIYKIDSAYGASLAKENLDERTAAFAVLNLTDELNEAYTGKPRGNEEGENGKILTVTRLSQATITIVPVFVSDKGWSLKIDGEVFDPHSPLSHELVKQIYMRQIKISRPSLIKELITKELPISFKENSLLNHFIPLQLVSDGANIGNYSIFLDLELGLTFKKNNQE